MKKNYQIVSFLFPSLADIIFISVFITLMIPSINNLLSDCDTGYHIRTGEYIINTCTIPTKDIFSFHSPAPPWIAHEWLSEMLMAVIHNFAGLSGIVIFFSTIISLAYYLLFRIIKFSGANNLLALLIVILIICASQMHWLARPHIFTILFVIIWYYILDCYQNKHINRLFCFIPIMLFWVNIHAGFIIGFILNGVYLFGNVFNLNNLSATEKIEGIEKIRNLFFITAFCLLISLLNPFGFKILLFPFKLLSDKYIIDRIGEFLSPNFHLKYFIPFELILLFLMLILSVSKKSLTIIEILVILIFAHMALFSVRNIPLFCIAAAPIMARQATQILADTKIKFLRILDVKIQSINRFDSSSFCFFWPSVVISFFLLFIYQDNFKYNFDDKIKPVEAAEFLEHQSIKGNMFNEYEFGDYIIYRNFPKYKVFIDGRADVYGSILFEEYQKIRNFSIGWEKLIDKYNITWIIFNSDSQFSRFLLQNIDWKLIYADNVANIFIKKIPENIDLIARYNDVMPFKAKH